MGKWCVQRSVKDIGATLQATKAYQHVLKGQVNNIGKIEPLLRCCLGAFDSQLNMNDRSLINDMCSNLERKAHCTFSANVKPLVISLKKEWAVIARELVDNFGETFRFKVEERF